MLLSFEELTSIARGAVEAVESATPSPVVVIVIVANEHPHREDLARYAGQWNLSRKEDVAAVCRLMAKAAEAS